MPSATVITRAGALAALLACLAGPAAYAQADAAPPSANAAAAWRAASRLGYAPTPASAQAAEAAPRAWALQQIDAAYAASRRPPAIPAELAGINAPLNDIARSFYAEREARKTGVKTPRTEAKPGAARQTPMRGRKIQPRHGAGRRRLAADVLQRPGAGKPAAGPHDGVLVQPPQRVCRQGPGAPFVGHYVVNVIRPNALGRFEDLLLASARHPAMLFYLDQAQSNNRGINENYARELMELHTLGVNSGYTQKDVHELARILTGWTVNLRDGEGFRFAERLHDKDGKVLLGRTFGSEGVSEGEEAIRYLARRPETARRVSTRLASFFVADKPSSCAGRPAGDHLHQLPRATSAR
jgi:hypothetical protein